MSIVIRPAEKRDLDQITAIYGRSVSNACASFELNPPGIAEMTKRWQALVDAGYPYIVAVKDETVLGYAYAGPYRTRPAYRFTVEDTIYVAESAQRAGIGGKLLGHLIDLCAQADFRQMIAIIGDPDGGGSVALHKRYGFSHAGHLEFVGYKHDRWLDTVLMQRALGRGETAKPNQNT